jgi:hypothetical protein
MEEVKGYFKQRVLRLCILRGCCPNRKAGENLLGWGKRLRESRHNGRFYLSAPNAFKALRSLGHTPSKGENVAGRLPICRLSC